MITAILTLLVGWALIFCVLAGLGQLIRRAFGLTVSEPGNWFNAFWLGYALAIAALEAWHLVLPIDWRVCLVLAILGFVGLICGIRQPRKQPIFTRRWLFQWLVQIVVIAPIALWIASRALSPQLDFDTGMYHMSTIRWLNDYAAVPGLGNLHYRLAFNQSFFTFVAALNVYPFFYEGFHLANSLLMMVLVAQLINTVANVVFGSLGAVKWSPQWLLSALFIPVVLYRASHQPYSANMSSPSPDLSIFVFQVVVILAFVGYLFTPKALERERRFTLFFIIAVSVVGVTSKLSFAMFGAVTIGVILAIWLWTHRLRWHSAVGQAALWLAIVGAGLGLPWMANGIIASGYPLFPSTFGALPVDYRVPASIATDAADWVRAFARDPHGDESVTLSTWDWLPTWQYMMEDSFDQFLFADPFYTFLYVLAGYTILFVLSRLLFRRRPYRYRAWLVLLPAFLSAIFWFWSAPDPRFAGAAFWILALWSLTLVFMLFPRRIPRWIVYPILVAPIVIGMVVVATGLNADFTLDGLGFPPLPQQAITQFKTDSGLLVNVSANPNDTLELWDAPLPASPYKFPLLELRGTNLKDGFRMRPDPSTPPPSP